MKPHVFGMIIFYRSLFKNDADFNAWLKREDYTQIEIERIYEKLNPKTPYQSVRMHEVVRIL